MRRTTTIAAALLMLGGLSASAQPAVDGEPSFVVGYMGSFVKSCVKQVHAAPPVPQVACACMAALTADRATKGRDHRGEGRSRAPV